MNFHGPNDEYNKFDDDNNNMLYLQLNKFRRDNNNISVAMCEVEKMTTATKETINQFWN